MAPPRSVVNFLAAQWRLQQKELKKLRKVEEASAVANAEGDYLYVDKIFDKMVKDLDDHQFFMEEKLKKLHDSFEDLEKVAIKTAVTAAAKVAGATVVDTFKEIIPKVMEHVKMFIPEIMEQVNAKIGVFDEEM